MRLMDAILGRPSRPRRQVEAARQAPAIVNQLTEYATVDDALRAGASGWTVSDSGVSVTRSSSEQLSAVYSCVRVLANGIAGLPLLLYREDEDGNKLPDRSNPLFRLLHDQPNQNLTSFQLRKMMLRDLCLAGNAYCFLVRGSRRQVIEILRLHPAKTKVEQDAATLEKRYHYSRRSGETVTFTDADVMHVWLDSDDGVEGINPIAMHRETFGDAIALRTHGSRFFSNGAKPLGVLQVEGRMPAEAKAQMRKDFKRLYSGSDNAHEVAILDQGVSYKQVSISMEDAQYLEARKFSRSEIAGLYGVPPHMIGDLDKATFSNIEHQRRELVTDAFMPYMVAIEQAVRRDILAGMPGHYVRHNADAQLRGDIKSRSEALQIQRRNGVISADEWRRKEDMNPRGDDGGKQYIREANMQPDTAGAGPGEQPDEGGNQT